MNVRNVLFVIKEHKFNSLFFKYLKTMLLFFLSFSVVLVAVVFFYTLNNLNNERNNSVEKISNATEVQFQNIIQRIDDVTYMIVNDSSIVKYLNENEDIAQNRSNALPMVKTFSQGVESNCIDSVFLYSFANEYVYSTKYSSANINEFFDTEWYKEYTDNNKIVAYSSNEKYSTVPAFLSVTIPIYQKEDVMGLLVFNIDINRFFEQNIPDDMGIIISDRNYKKIVDYNIPQNYSEGRKSGIGITNIGEMDLTFSVVPASGLFPQITAFIIIMLFFFVISVLISVLIAFIAASICYDSIISITTNINMIINGETPAEPQYEETKSINSNLLNIVLESHSLEKKLAGKILELNRLTMQAMQLQINPHFLFNTLTMMNMIAMKSCIDENLSKSILLLSEILRNALNTSEVIVSLRSEVEYTQKYIDILYIREMNSFKAVWEIPDELMEKKVVKFSLQPLIENAFEHGIKSLRVDQERLIIIKAFERNGKLVVQIKDNGNTISDGRIKQINELIANSDLPANKHVGLKNINVRIKLTFGEEYGCRLLRENKMTVSELVFPMQ